MCLGALELLVSHLVWVVVLLLPVDPGECRRRDRIQPWPANGNGVVLGVFPSSQFGREGQTSHGTGVTPDLYGGPVPGIRTGSVSVNDPSKYPLSIADPIWGMVCPAARVPAGRRLGKRWDANAWDWCRRPTWRTVGMESAS